MEKTLQKCRMQNTCKTGELQMYCLLFTEFSLQGQEMQMSLCCNLYVHSISLSFPAMILFMYSNACKQTLSNTFKEVDRISSAVPHVNVSVHAARGQPMPAHLHRHRIPEPRPVITVLIEPVPAVTHEVGVKTHHHLAVRCLLLPDPIKHGAEATLTHT